MLKTLATAAGLALAAVPHHAATRPDTFRVERQITIGAQAER